MDRMGAREPVAERIADLADRIGVTEFVVVCTDLMQGADRLDHLEALRALTGLDWSPGAAVFDRERWQDYWLRTWGARGLLHVWHDSATPAVVAGLSDDHWRPAEMCLKVTTRHEVAGAGDGAAGLGDHALPRVRAQAMRALSVAGDTEHLAAVEARLDDDDADVRRQAERTREALRRRLGL